ncbi:MAG: hypothetical protein NG737_07535 [Omnitrophica bacterium]|nr:hypothetical protein [Candidatus Omnitrophota bacterium]
MRKIVLLSLVLAIFSVGVFCAGIGAQPSQDYLIKSLDVLVDAALMAYNFEDYIKFTEYFAKSMESSITEGYFNEIYLKFYKKTLGYIKFKKLSLEQSSLDPNRPALVYKAIFEKYDKVIITVNFMKEYDNYRITQIKFDKVYPSMIKLRPF